MSLHHALLSGKSQTHVCAHGDNQNISDRTGAIAPAKSTVPTLSETVHFKVALLTGAYSSLYPSATTEAAIIQ